MEPDVKLVPINAAEAELLNDLIRLNLDGQHGYETAAADLQNAAYRDLLETYATERAALAAALRSLLQKEGHQPEGEGSFTGAFHQGWINLKAALSQGDAPILAECEQADRLALTAYQNVMGQTTNAPLLETLRSHHSTIKLAYERVKGLRAALEQVGR
jgi:uncharacterized protein (TIGR02284 family)